MPLAFRVFLGLSYTGFGLALAAIPLAARRASKVSWAVFALLVALWAVALMVVCGRWIYDGMVSWWRIGAFYLAQFIVPTAVGAWVASVAAARWPTHRWLLTSVTVIGVFLLAQLVGSRAQLLPDLVTAVQ